MNTSNNHGSSTTTGKRKRSRTSGSKSKSKYSVPTSTPGSDAATFQTHLLEIPAGGDVAETLAFFVGDCHSFGVCILSASGCIRAAVLWEASPYPSTIALQGCFDLLSITATILPGRNEGSLAVTLAGPQGEVVGGLVAGPVVAASTVIVVAGTFTSPAIHRCDEINNYSISMLPASIGVEKEASGGGMEYEKLEDNALKRQINELEEILDRPVAVDDIFSGGEEVNVKVLEQFMREWEQCLQLPSAACSTSSGECITIDLETEALDMASVQYSDIFEQYSGVTAVVDSVFESDGEGCDEHFAFDGFWASPPRLPYC